MKAMYSEPTVLPLNTEGTNYALQDNNGVIMGTGTREVCEVLVSIINNQKLRRVNQVTETRLPRSNIRAAIVI